MGRTQIHIDRRRSRRHGVAEGRVELFLAEALKAHQPRWTGPQRDLNPQGHLPNELSDQRASGRKEGRRHEDLRASKSQDGDVGNGSIRASQRDLAELTQRQRDASKPKTQVHAQRLAL